MIKKTFVTLPIDEIIEYENNPRKNEQAVEAVAESIRQCEYVAPIIVDENHVILAGHTRKAALVSMGGLQTEVIVCEGLTEEQKRKYRLLDNKTSEFAKWDTYLLTLELDDLDFGGFDFGFDYAEYEFDETELDNDVKKDKVTVTLKFASVEDYTEAKERLQNIADELDASMAVKMS